MQQYKVVSLAVYNGKFQKQKEVNNFEKKKKNYIKIGTKSKI